MVEPTVMESTVVKTKSTVAVKVASILGVKKCTKKWCPFSFPYFGGLATNMSFTLVTKFLFKKFGQGGDVQFLLCFSNLLFIINNKS